MLNPAAAALASNLFTRVFDDQSAVNLDFPTVGQVLTCILSGLVLGILIGLVYMFTHRKTGYSQSYVIAMPMLSSLVASIIVMMCLLANSTIGITASISLTGAFSLVRFRSAQGTADEIASVLIAMASGVCFGMG